MPNFHLQPIPAIMRNILLRNIFLSLLCVCTFALLGNSSVAGEYRAGAAKKNITPESFMMMAGYASRTKPADDKLTDLWAKALILEDANTHRLVWITLDLIGIDRALSQSISKRLEAEYKLDRDQISICTSHTHTGPVVARNLRPMHYELLTAEQRKQVEDYANALEQNVTEVVGDAINAMTVCDVAHGSGVAAFAVNRRENREADIAKLRIEGKLSGPFDHDAPVLAVRNQKGDLQAVLFGYACHSTTLSFYKWSGDYPGFAQIELEENNPGAVALFWAGCGADQNPLPRRTVELAEQYGHRLAASVEKVLDGEMHSVEGDFSSTYKEITLPLQPPPSQAQLQTDAKSKNRFVAARAKMFISDLGLGKPLPTDYPYPIQSWKLGDDVQFVALGGEVVVDYAVRLKTELAKDDKSTNVWVAGYANDVMAYIPSRRVLREGGYEGGGAMVYYGLPAPWAPEVEELIIKETKRQAAK